MRMTLEDGNTDFIGYVNNLKRLKRLHGEVEKRLSVLLAHLYPNAPAISEVSGILGGRNDLIQFFFSGRKVVFELFFSPSQVSQDLRLLEQSQAEVKIAVLLDREINSKLAAEYFRKKPDSFPFLWLSEVLLPSHESTSYARLRELIDENAAIVRLRRVLEHPAGEQFEPIVRDLLRDFETTIALRTLDTPKPANTKMTHRQVISLIILGQVKKLGIPPKTLHYLYGWLQSNLQEILTSVEQGFKTYLVTDLGEKHYIWNDKDLADILILNVEGQESVHIVVFLNNIVNDFWGRIGYEAAPILWHLFHFYAEDRVIVFPPAKQHV